MVGYKEIKRKYKKYIKEQKNKNSKTDSYNIHELMGFGKYFDDINNNDLL